MAIPSSPNDPTTDPSIQDLLAARPWLKHDAMAGLMLDDVPLAGIADAVGTPTWVYSAATMRARYKALTGAMTDAGLDMHVHYAVKANDSRAVLSLFADQGAGADVVSGGELLKARRAGIPASRIVYSGVGKSEQELRLALSEDVGQINIESAEELAMLSALASAAGRTARVALRVNPNVDAGTNDKITTGRATDKFGIAYDDALALYAKAAAMPGIEPVGLAVHIGSQILGLAPYRAAFGRIAGLVQRPAPGGAARRDGRLRRRPRHSLPQRAGAIPGRPGRRDESGVPQPGRPPRHGAWPLAGRSRRVAAGFGRPGQADAARTVRGAGRRHERPGAAGDV